MIVCWIITLTVPAEGGTSAHEELRWETGEPHRTVSTGDFQVMAELEVGGGRGSSFRMTQTQTRKIKHILDITGV